MSLFSSLPSVVLLADTSGTYTLSATSPLTEAAVTLATLAVAGGLGGFVAGIRTNSAHSIVIPFLIDRGLNLGFLGDIVIGMTTGIAIMFLGGAVLGITNQHIGSNSTPYDVLRLVALGIISGFGGLSILAKLSDNNLSERLTAISHQVEKNQHLGEILREATSLRAQLKYRESHLFYQRALEIDPSNEEALVCGAVVWSYVDEPGHYVEAINRLQMIVQSHPQSARAFYNMHCLKALATEKKVMTYPTAEILSALESAIKLEPERYRIFAADDPDLASLKAVKDFNSLIRPKAGNP